MKKVKKKLVLLTLISIMVFGSAISAYAASATIDTALPNLTDSNIISVLHVVSNNKNSISITPRANSTPAYSKVLHIEYTVQVKSTYKSADGASTYLFETFNYTWDKKYNNFSDAIVWSRANSTLQLGGVTYTLSAIDYIDSITITLTLTDGRTLTKTSGTNIGYN